MASPSAMVLVLSALLGAPQEPAQQLPMSALHQRAKDRFADGDVRGAVEDLDAILANPRLGPSEPLVRLLAAQYRVVLGDPREALADVEVVEELLADDDSQDAVADRCHAAGVRALAYLNLGLHELAGASLGAMFAHLDELRAAGHPEVARETLFRDTVYAVYLMSLEEYGDLDAWVADRLEEDLYEEPSAYSVKLELARGLGLRARARLAPGRAADARTALEAVVQSAVAQRADRLRAAHTLGDLAISEGDLPAADRWLRRTTSLLGENGAARDPEAHLRQTTLATRFALEAGAPREVLSGLEEELREALDAMVRPTPRRGGTGFLSYTARRAAIGELIRCRLATGEDGPAQALAVLLAIQDRTTLQARLGGGATSLEDVRRSLLGGARGHVLLQYFPTPERTHLFVVDVESVAHLELPLHDRVETLAAELAGTLGRPADEPAIATRQRALREDLAAALLPAAVRARLAAADRVTVVASAFRSTIPFEVLPLERSPGDGGSLGTALALDNLPSLGVGARLAERREEPVALESSRVLVVVGDVSTSADGELGERIASEPARLVGGHPEEAVVVLAGTQATREELRARAESCSLLQFFTHGRYDRTRERPAGLLLAPWDEPRGFLGADEIQGLDGEGPLVAPSTVILTACGAGRERVRVGDAGANDLAGALFLASERTHCVVLSAFDLDVEATRRFSVALHDELREGHTVAEAARRARASVAADERFADPHYHALLRVVGLGHTPVFRERR